MNCTKCQTSIEVNMPQDLLQKYIDAGHPFMCNDCIDFALEDINA